MSDKAHRVREWYWDICVLTICTHYSNALHTYDTSEPNVTHEKGKHSCQPSAQFMSHQFYNWWLYVTLHMPICPDGFFLWKMIKTQNQIYSLGDWLQSYANKIAVTLKWSYHKQICLLSQNSFFGLNKNKMANYILINFTLHILEGQIHYLYRCYLTSIQQVIHFNLLINTL